MKKFSLIFRLSFLSYTLSAIALPTASSLNWVTFAHLAFFTCCCYQLIYIFFLRKKENVSFSHSIAVLFLYVAFAFQLFVIMGYSGIVNKILGYNSFDTDSLLFFFFHLPIFLLCIIYQICYFIKKYKH